MKWRPSASQRAAYKAAHEQAAQHTFIQSGHPIRTGDYVEFYDLTANTVRKGTIARHSYGVDRGQHTFTVVCEDGQRLIKGRNLYPKLLAHTHVGESPTQKGT